MSHTTTPSPEEQAGPAKVYVAQPQQQYVVAAVAQPVYRVAGPTNGLATASLTLGILAVVLAWVPVVGVILAVVGLGLGVPALVRATASGIGKTMSIWGLSLSGVGVLLFLLLVAAA